MLGGAIQESSVEVGVGGRAHGWRAAGPGYLEAMIRTIEELGPYAVIAPGVAMPHARSSDPIDLVFGLAAPEDGEHAGLLRGLADFFDEAGNSEALRRARDAPEAMRVLERGWSM